MPTDTAPSHHTAVKFVASAIAASLAIFGALRLPWIETHVLLPLTRGQGIFATRIFGAPALPVEVTLACSGADTMALCLGAVLAYPVAWRSRLAGAAGGIALILALNIVRIGTLGRAAGAPGQFDALHLYVWPAVLTLAIASYVFAWMRVADRQPAFPALPRPTRRFAWLAGVWLLLFAAAAPWYLESGAVLAIAGVIAHSAAVILSAAGVTAYAAANVLWTSRGGFLVTQECISTPLIPLYAAAVCAFGGTWRRIAAGVAAALPLFVALGVVRLLLVALPDVVAPLFFVHAFYQLLLAGVLIAAAATWRHGVSRAAGYALAGIAAGVLLVAVLGPAYTRSVMALAGEPHSDPQGAVALLPAFQIGLYVALWIAAGRAIAWRYFFAGLAAIVIMQALGLQALNLWTGETGLTAHVRDIRGWAVAAPVFIAAAVIHVSRPRH